MEKEKTEFGTIRATSDGFVGECNRCHFKSEVKKTETKARQSLTMHHNRTHGNQKGNPASKTKKKKTAKEQPTVAGPSFCPNCGFNLHILTMAFRIANK